MLIVIEPLTHRVSGALIERRCRITRSNSEGTEHDCELWFLFDESLTPPAADDCDAYLLAVIMDAMKERRNIDIKGSISRELLSNLVEYQAAWNKWLPETYSQISISCTTIREPATRQPGAICAFSGGVDATFSVWMHSQAKLSHRSRKINLCAMVHGFDIPLKDESAFQSALEIARHTLHDLAIDLYPIKTNYRQISGVNWEHAFSCALTAALSNFKAVAGTCLVGSSEPYDSLVIPWGSSPITDHLLSSDDFVVMHDGASHSRTEKVREISSWQVGTKNLRVCWQGAQKDRNCGKCEKCVRTKLNFLATGNPIPAGLPSTHIVDEIKHIKLKSDAVRAEWRQIHHYALQNNIDANWTKQLPAIINKKAKTRILKKRASRNLLDALKSKLGLGRT